MVNGTSSPRELSPVYAPLIRETLARQGRIGTNPYHVEAWMRLVYGTLDALGGAEWQRAVREAVQCLDAVTTQENGALADTYGLGEVR